MVIRNLRLVTSAVFKIELITFENRWFEVCDYISATAFSSGGKNKCISPDLQKHI